MGKSKILVLVEGEKTDYKLMQHLLNVYGIGDKHEIVSYNTNIYTLYNEMFGEGDPDSLDIKQILKAHEKDVEKKKIFDINFSDVLLIFDLDPHDPQFSPDKIIKMAEYFVESSDMGKLYINYPMVEAFYHMKSIPDEDYNNYVATIDELKNKLYKTRVAKENRNHDYRKFAVNKEECSTIIRQNIEKAKLIANSIETGDILEAQLDLLSIQELISVLCTCAFYIPDYNSKFIGEL